MASATAAGLSYQNLSSNWRKLQEKLKVDTSQAPKRKAAALSTPPPSTKKRRIQQTKPKNLTNGQKASSEPSKMGLGWSSTKEGKQAPSATLALWAEDNDISTKDLHTAYGSSLKRTSIPDLSHATAEVVNQGLSPTALDDAGKYIALDCEMVGVGPTPETDSALARVSIVNYHGHQLYDSFVKPKEAVTDYRTFVSGITPQLLLRARSLEEVQRDVGALLEGRVLVGHAIRNDLDAMMLGHPRRDIRDTSRHKAFKVLAGGKTPGLKKLAREVLGVDIQGGEHSSVEDARATMLLFRREKEEFDREHLALWGVDRRVGERVEGDGSKAKQKRKRKKAKR